VAKSTIFLFAANSLLFSTVKEFLKSVNNYEVIAKSSTPRFYRAACNADAVQR